MSTWIFDFVIMDWPLLVCGSNSGSKKVLKILKKYVFEKMRFYAAFWNAY